ncbi:MAG TPA: hypothetical protein VFK48_19100 [Usitatibacter sp.]|nr:hypothetical protein [Usitatibacter sp.]
MSPLTRRFALAATLALAVAGCASVSPDAGAPAAPTAAAVPTIDLGSKFRVPDRERGRREKARMNAQYHLELEADENGPPSAAQMLRAQAQRREIERVAGGAKAAGLQPSQWQSIGPSNIGGRVRAIAFDPRAPRRVLAGTASGGLWESQDLGASWRANFDFLPNLSVTTVVFDPVNPLNVYLGTGEASAGLVGMGAFKSTDGGTTWKMLAATNVDANPDWRFVNRLAVHPTQPQVLLAALTHNNGVNGAIYRSADGGATWLRVSTLKALDIAFDPANPANALAGLDDGAVAYSRDGGNSWSRSAPLVADPSGRSATARIEIAFARSEPGLAYASVDNAKGEVWRSVDSGATWTKLSTPGHLNNQGDYDNAIWVDPTDASHVVVAGLDIYRSIDGGLTFLQVSDWHLTPGSPHADHHALVSPPDYSAANPTLLNGNDGGIYRTSNIRTVDLAAGWTNANNGLAVTQFYSGAGRTSAGGRIVGGTQDNGSLMFSANQWRTVRGGDGGFVAVDPRSDQTIYGSYVYLSIHRSQTGGVGAAYICQGITEGMPAEGGNAYCGDGASKKANFIAPFILDPNRPDRLLGGAASLWVTDNATAPAPAWRTIKPPHVSTPDNNYINAIEVQPGDSAAIWVGHNNGEVYRTASGLDAAPSWVRVGQGVLPGRRVQRITLDAGNPARAIVSYTGFVPDNVWQTLDNGATWSSITANLPAAPVFDVKRHPTRPDWLYAATSVGVFTSENGGQSWSTTNEGPANIRVRELFWIDNATLGAATYGRGMFKVSVAAGGPGNYQDLWWSGPLENGWGISIAQHGATLFSAIYIYDAQGKPTWVTMPGGSWDAGFTTFTGTLYAPTGSHWASYDPARWSVGAPVGTASLRFTGLNDGVLTYEINGVRGEKPITRNVFGAKDGTPTASYGDLWWGGDGQNGWGVTIAQQYRALFLAWYTYDEAGKPTWFVVSGGEWISANEFRGRAYRTSGSPWLGAAYNAAAFRPQDVGEVELRFNDVNHAVMTYTIDGVRQVKPLTRFGF